ncbi:hypothetical protein K7X08_018904 [Anisodus acutangulus]|uniref:Uncharacterized protein n=1 Tax=Anisodus acutangulus TaxID=402998 RepID=A0A9Q1LWJ2_9SOLA|nr:hypothetical protein K7X08_018904 [Anisodus acutangulus]
MSVFRFISSYSLFKTARCFNCVQMISYVKEDSTTSFILTSTCMLQWAPALHYSWRKQLLQRLCSLYKLALNLRMDRAKFLAVFLSFLLVTCIQCRPIARITNHSLHSESIKHSNPQSGDHNQGMKVHQLGGSSLSLIEAKNSGPSPGEGHAVAHGAHNDHH